MTVEDAENELKQAMRVIAVDMYKDTLFNELPFFAMIFDKQGIIQAANQTACEVLGYGELELVGTNYQVLCDPSYNEGNQLLVDEMLSGEHRPEGLYMNEYIKKDGGKVKLYWDVGREIWRKELFMSVALFNVKITNIKEYGN